MDDLKYIREPEPHLLLDKPNKNRFAIWIFSIISILFLMVIIRSVLVIIPPKNFPKDSVFIVNKGDTVSLVAKKLKEQNIIKSPLYFKVSTMILSNNSGIKAGNYYLKETQNVFILAYRLSNAKFNLQNEKITIPEGLNSIEIAELFDLKKFINFNKKEFLKKAESKEGYLFPDTYFFLPTITADEVIKTLNDNYKKKISEIQDQINKFNRPLRDIIIMASIIEEEARTEESRKIIAGILWKRLDEGMLLQVDASFAFVNGKKASSEITLEDLKIDSPYNTYVRKGLPIGPISNPGIDSIMATINPISSPYYFYLSDNDGEMHYAINHENHVINKDKYLR